ncbi:MAG: GDSL-type esterase/lipase family protein [Treponema sp.]|jgi:lysophospholipase L1-like esterase|nr:GDSL-type esterase/lipase family protein [Treponema sp.]
MQRKNVLIGALVLINAVLLVFLTIVSFHYQVPQKVLNRLGIINLPVSRVHPGYNKNNIISLTYERGDFDILMLGDSITNNGNWNELFKNKKIANLGINGDTTEGVLNRLSDVYLLNPRKCLLMIGINDLHGNRSVEDILENYRKIVREIKQHDITLIIQPVLHLGEKYHINHTAGKNRNDWENINKKVQRLNKELEKMANGYEAEYIDLNKELSVNNILIEKYGAEDGLHISQPGYEKWAEIIRPFIE